MKEILAKSKTYWPSGVYKSVHTKMDSYLKKRTDGKSDMFYVEYPIPVELQAHFKKRYERKSTGTANPQEARRVAAQLAVQFENKYRALRLELAAADADIGPARTPAPHVALSEDLIAGLCERWHIAHLHADDRERDDGLERADLDDIAAYASAIERDAREIMAMRHKAPSFVHVREEACDWAETVGYGIASNDPAMATYVQKFAAGKFAIAKALLARNQGEPVITPELPERFRGQTLTEYKSTWLNDRIAGLAEKTKDLYAGRIDQFTRFLASRFPEMNDMPLRAVEGRHIQGFVAFLMNEEQLHPGSINDGHLPPLRSIFKYALSDGQTLSNPCAHVVLPKISKQTAAARAQPRTTFSEKFLNTLFASAWYGVGEEGLLRSPVYADLATRYWVPLILLAHGLRPIEVCQLTLADVFYSGSLLCFAVTDDQPGQTVKTEATRRGLPVHPKLLDLGFADFIDRRQRDGLPADRLFPALEGRVHPAKWFTQQFNRYTRDYLDAPTTYTVHSFRHFWENSLRGARAIYGGDRWPKGMHFQISGREDVEREEGSGKDYGDNYTQTQMEPFLKLIWNGQIVLPMHYAQFESVAFVSFAARDALAAYVMEVKR